MTAHRCDYDDATHGACTAPATRRLTVRCHGRARGVISEMCAAHCEHVLTHGVEATVEELPADDDDTEAGTDLAATKKKVQEIAEQRGAVTWEDYLEVDLGFDTDPHWGLAHEQKGGPLPARLSLGTTVWEIMQTRSGLRRGRHKGYNNVNSAPVPKTAEGEMTLVVRDTPETRAGLAALHRRITVFAADLFKELAQADTEAVLARYAREGAETLAVPDAPAAKKPKRRTTR